MANPQEDEVDRNWAAFRTLLPDIIHAHRGRHALMKDQEVVDYFDGSWAAFEEGKRRFRGEPFSVQEVTDEVVDLGFYSHVAGALRA